MRAWFLLGFGLVCASGCGGRSYKYVPVSGTVTLNGHPLANATVTFLPVAPEGTTEAGDSSVGKTNEKGEFTLETVKGVNGALVGRHNVSVSQLNPDVGDTDRRPRRGALTNALPRRYNNDTELTFEVPAGGTDKAEFKLTSP